MSRALQLGPVTLALPLRVTSEVDRSHVGPADENDLSRQHATLINRGHFQIARLFAASPDLLLAAEAVIACGLTDLRLDPEQSAALSALRTAIARARGST